MLLGEYCKYTYWRVRKYLDGIYTILFAARNILQGHKHDHPLGNGISDISPLVNAAYSLVSSAKEAH